MTWKNETTGQRLPAPLPMYEPVRLKHVPTFVRRKYDRDLNVIDDANEGLSSEESQSDGDDGVEDNDNGPTVVGGVVDDGVDDDNEVEDNTHTTLDDTEEVTTTQSFNNDFRSSSSNKSSYSITYDDDDSKIKDDKDQDVNHCSSHVDGSVDNNTQDKDHAKSDMNDHGSDSKDQKDEVDANNIAGNEVDASNIAGNEVEDNQKGFHEQDNKSKDEYKGGIVATQYENGSIDGVVQNNAQEHGNFDHDDQSMEIIQSLGESKVVKDDKDQDDANDLSSHVDVSVDDEDDDEEAKDGIIVASCYENGSVYQDEVQQDNKHENLYNEQGLLEEDDKSEGNEAEGVINNAAAASNNNIVDDEVEDDGQANLDTEHDTQTCTTVNVDNYSLGSSASFDSEENKCESEILHKDDASSVVEASVEETIPDHGLESSYMNDQDMEEEDKANDVNLKGYGDTNVNKGAQHEERGVDLHGEDCKGVEDGSRDVTVANNYLDDSVKFKLKEITEKQENFDIGHGVDLHVEDCKSNEDGSSDVTVVISYLDEGVFKLKEITEQKHENFDIEQGIEFQAQLSSLPSIPWFSRRLFIQVKWDPHHFTNYLKLNFDGSTLSPKAGIIIRDSNGSILSAQVYKMGHPHPITPITAQAWAIRNGLLQAHVLMGHSPHRHCCTNNMTENRSLVRTISCDYQRPWNLQFVVEDFKHHHT